MAGDRHVPIACPLHVPDVSLGRAAEEKSHFVVKGNNARQVVCEEMKGFLSVAGRFFPCERLEASKT